MRSLKPAAALAALLLAWSACGVADEGRHRDGRNAFARDHSQRETRQPAHRAAVPFVPAHRHAVPTRPAWQGDIHRFHDHDVGVWRGGRWHHGWHEGRLGWWWIVGSLWYLYPNRIAPYPDPAPPVTVLEAPPQQYWYYCPDPAGYYPYVPRCAYPWQPVPAQ